jgi:hypothetical protein
MMPVRIRRRVTTETPMRSPARPDDLFSELRAVPYDLATAKPPDPYCYPR